VPLAQRHQRRANALNIGGFKVKLKRIALTALALILIIMVFPVTSLAAQEDEPRIITLTPVARDIALADFDYFVAKVIEVAPTQNIIYRRFGWDAVDFFAFYREFIYNKVPLPSILSVIEPERWADAPTDDISIAADYILTITVFITYALDGLGHFGSPVHFIVEQTFFALAHTMYHNPEISQEEVESWLAQGYSQEDITISKRNFQAGLNFSQLHYALYNTPSVLWFYNLDSSELDFDVEVEDVLVGNEDPYNISTEILVPGYVAYMHIASFLSNMRMDNEILLPFYEEIQDFDHLIIDIRGNSGGWSAHFPDNVISMLIDEAITFYYYEFFIASERTADFFNEPHSMANADLYGVFPIAEFVENRNMYQFNPYDLALLDYAIVWRGRYFPAENNVPFGGKIWLLVDNESASASELAAIISIGTGFATVVGEPTRGITGVIYTFAALPNTGILFRIDLGYKVDQYGRSIEEFGVIPQIFNAEGMDALETVLALISS